MSTTKTQLEELIADKENKVIALSGRWGTGKTYMWSEVKKSSQDDMVAKALSVSLFGAASVADLKLRLVQKAVPYLRQEGPRKDVLAASWRVVRKVASFVHPTLPLAAQLAEFAVPGLLREKFIVIDDVERKREALTTDEVLGFIDDFVQNYGCRFLLILNSDKLTDVLSWERYREKVVDAELKLETTPAEAFDIAAQACSPAFYRTIKTATEICNLSNVRVIRKVIKTVTNILGGRSDLSEELLARLVPSAVVLSAMHFKGIDGGPSTEFVLSYDPAKHSARNYETKLGQANEAVKVNQARWSLLLKRLGINGVGRYERLVADYLASGGLDVKAVNDVVEQYLHDTRLLSVQSRFNQLFQDSFWRPEMSDVELLHSANDLVRDVHFLDCFSVTALASFTSQIPGGFDLSEKIIDRYVDVIKEEAAKPDAKPNNFVVNDFFNRPIESRISQAFEEARALIAKPDNLLTVCLELASKSGWGSDEEAAMNGSTVEDYKQTILNAGAQDRKIFILKNTEWLANRDNFRKHFGRAMDNFVEACREICAERDKTRWPKLLHEVFRASGVEHLLNRPDPPSPVQDQGDLMR